MSSFYFSSSANHYKVLRKEDDKELIAALKKDAEKDVNTSAEVEVSQEIGKKEMSETGMKIGGKSHVSLKFGVVGSGQAGGRMAEVFHKFGYETCAINTAKQDLEFLSMPESRKLVVEGTLSGSGKDIDIGRAAVEGSLETISNFVAPVIDNCDVAILTLSLGGGSGSGSAVPMVNLLAGLGKPLIVLAALPGSFDDGQSNFNAMQTLSHLADLSTKGVISSLMIIDNEKSLNTHSGLSQSKFFDVCNRSVIEPLLLFNQVTSMPSNIETMDPMDFSKALLEGGSCSLFGSIKVTKEEYSEEDGTGLLAAFMNKLEDALPASDFNLKEAQSIGILVTAKKEVLEAIPYTTIAYVFKYAADEFDSAKGFKGVYELPSDSDDIQISFVFSGMGLPHRRVEALKVLAEKHAAKVEEKKKQTAAGMVVAGQKGPVSKADQMISKVKSQNSALGKLLGNAQANKIDRKR